MYKANFVEGLGCVARGRQLQIGNDQVILTASSLLLSGVTLFAPVCPHKQLRALLWEVLGSETYGFQ